MLSKIKEDRKVLCSENVALKIGNIFDSVLVLASRMRELKSGALPLTEPGVTLLGTAYREAEQGFLSSSSLHQPQMKVKNETRT